MKKQGASVVVSHHILEGKHEDYEVWLCEIAPGIHKAFFSKIQLSQ